MLSLRILVTSCALACLLPLSAHAADDLAALKAELEALKAETGVRLFGINQADAPENARAFLEELGNPYDAVGADRDRRASIDWGVYGVPETFIVDADGVITYKHVGPLTAQSLEQEVIPALKKAGS